MRGSPSEAMEFNTESWELNTGHEKWLRECYRQVKAGVTKCSRDKLHQTWGPPFSRTLYYRRLEVSGEPRIECPQAEVLYTNTGDYKDFGAIPNVGSWEDCGRICSLITTCNNWSWGNEENEDDKMFCTFYESAAELEFNPEYISGGRGCPETD